MFAVSFRQLQELESGLPHAPIVKHGLPSARGREGDRERERGEKRIDRLGPCVIIVDVDVIVVLLVGGSGGGGVVVVVGIFVVRGERENERKDEREREKEMVLYMERERERIGGGRGPEENGEKREELR